LSVAAWLPVCSSSRFQKLNRKVAVIFPVNIFLVFCYLPAYDASHISGTSPSLRLYSKPTLASRSLTHHSPPHLLLSLPSKLWHLASHKWNSSLLKRTVKLPMKCKEWSKDYNARVADHRHTSSALGMSRFKVTNQPEQPILFQRVTSPNKLLSKETQNGTTATAHQVAKACLYPCWFFDAFSILLSFALFLNSSRWKLWQWDLYSPAHMDTTWCSRWCRARPSSRKPAPMALK